MSVNTTQVTAPALLELPMKMIELQGKFNERMLKLAAHQAASTGTAKDRLLDVTA
ncbi:MAG: hypothetical protein KDK41_07455 [Leptospiraceae bacterium]|nr:hypothetical protein [Leptospiraceae bacterium]MCB1200466.1 hypothetical protein [Leptospiraceae bacterium]